MSNIRNGQGQNRHLFIELSEKSYSLLMKNQLQKSLEKISEAENSLYKKLNKSQMKQCSLQISNLYYIKGLILDRMKDLNKSLLAYQRAFEENHKNKCICNNIGKVYLQMQKYDQAEKFLHWALQLDNKLLQAYVNLAYLYFETNDFEKCILICLEALSKNINDFMLHEYLGICYAIENKKYSESLKHLKEYMNSCAISKFKPSFLSLKHMANGLLVESQYEEALNQIEKAITYYPLEYESLFLRAQILYQLDKLDEAEKEILNYAMKYEIFIQFEENEVNKDQLCNKEISAQKQKYQMVSNQNNEQQQCNNNNINQKQHQDIEISDFQIKNNKRIINQGDDIQINNTHQNKNNNNKYNDTQFNGHEINEQIIEGQSKPSSRNKNLLNQTQNEENHSLSQSNNKSQSKNKVQIQEKVDKLKQENRFSQLQVDTEFSKQKQDQQLNIYFQLGLIYMKKAYILQRQNHNSDNKINNQSVEIKQIQQRAQKMFEMAKQIDGQLPIALNLGLLNEQMSKNEESYKIQFQILIAHFEQSNNELYLNSDNYHEINKILLNVFKLNYLQKYQSNLKLILTENSEKQYFTSKQNVQNNKLSNFNPEYLEFQSNKRKQSSDMNYPKRKISINQLKNINEQLEPQIVGVQNKISSTKEKLIDIIVNQLNNLNKQRLNSNDRTAIQQFKLTITDIDISMIAHTPILIQGHSNYSQINEENKRSALLSSCLISCEDLKENDQIVESNWSILSDYYSLESPISIQKSPLLESQNNFEDKKIVRTFHINQFNEKENINQIPQQYDKNDKNISENNKIKDNNQTLKRNNILFDENNQLINNDCKKINKNEQQIKMVSEQKDNTHQQKVNSSNNENIIQSQDNDKQIECNTQFIYNSEDSLQSSNNTVVNQIKQQNIEDENQQKEEFFFNDINKKSTENSINLVSNQSKQDDEDQKLTNNLDQTQDQNDEQKIETQTNENNEIKDQFNFQRSKNIKKNKSIQFSKQKDDSFIKKNLKKQKCTCNQESSSVLEKNQSSKMCNYCQEKLRKEQRLKKGKELKQQKIRVKEKDNNIQNVRNGIERQSTDTFQRIQKLKIEANKKQEEEYIQEKIRLYDQIKEIQYEYDNVQHQYRSIIFNNQIPIKYSPECIACTSKQNIIKLQATNDSADTLNICNSEQSQLQTQLNITQAQKQQQNKMNEQKVNQQPQISVQKTEDIQVKQEYRIVVQQQMEECKCQDIKLSLLNFNNFLKENKHQRDFFFAFKRVIKNTFVHSRYIIDQKLYVKTNVTISSIAELSLGFIPLFQTNLHMLNRERTQLQVIDNEDIVKKCYFVIDLSDSIEILYNILDSLSSALSVYLSHQINEYANNVLSNIYFDPWAEKINEILSILRNNYEISFDILGESYAYFIFYQFFSNFASSEDDQKKYCELNDSDKPKFLFQLIKDNASFSPLQYFNAQIKPNKDNFSSINLPPNFIKVHSNATTQDNYNSSHVNDLNFKTIPSNYNKSEVINESINQKKNKKKQKKDQALKQDKCLCKIF